MAVGGIHLADNAMALSPNVTPTDEAGIPSTRIAQVHQLRLLDYLYTQLTDEETTSSDPTSGVETSSDTDSTTASSPDSSTPRFTCQYSDGQYTVMYSPESDSESTSSEYYEWAIPGQMGGGWTPERRCNAIAERLEIYRPDGLLELQTGEENNLDIVCVTTTQNDDCRIVFTVPDGQDPIETRDRVFENLAVANSGQQTEGINTLHDTSSISSSGLDLGNILGIDLPQLPGQNTIPSFSGRSQGIDLRPFLAPADGGTGRNL
ncbi:MAG: hypothetical protein F6K09_09960 [Merismopedia sp. SIO2A8]|nr:hypothetical protein [Symploca sp. SIO2B6]NET49031.1 hypothetical protein [Merismopedia sp. SIO2A8]